MIKNFELAQGPRVRPPEAEECRHRMKPCSAELPIVVDGSEFGESKFIRLSRETLPDLKGRQLEFLRNLCFVAHLSEEFFLSVPTNQWVRTSVTCDKLPKKVFSPGSIVGECSKRVGSAVTICSNILPCDPFWTELQAIRDGSCKEVHFPCSILKESLQEGNTLIQKLLEWRERGGESTIDQHESEHDPSRLFWKIRASDEVHKDVKSIKELAQGSDGTIWLVTWRGGMFVRKDSMPRDEQDGSNSSDAPDTESIIVEKLSHPHIVFCFGVSYALNNRSLFMEHMQNDLYHCIVERVRTTGDNMPPFLHQDSVDILLQFAKAMAHMHEENVVHGDLKARNILINEVLMSEGATRYLVKVADFGSAKFLSSNFTPGCGSTKYSAPELLLIQDDRTKPYHEKFISFPKALDVYSFGIVAFEVLTGEELYVAKRPPVLKEGVIKGTLRPPLRAACGKVNFLQDEQLIKLIESCWHGDPLKRPSFSKIVEVLDSVRVQILKPPTALGDYPPPHANLVSNTSGAPEETPTSLSGHTPSQANFFRTDAFGSPQEAASGNNGCNSPPPFQANNTSDALHGQETVPGSGRHPSPPVRAHNTSDALYGQADRRYQHESASKL